LSADPRRIEISPVECSNLCRLWPIYRLKPTGDDDGVSRENITTRFGRRLRALRKAKGWTQVQMADALGIDRSYISDMERGKKNICLPTLEIIALGFETSMSKLVSGL
jgi:DNA-binding XRE family transcriptional regulator